jgi:quinol monooxygenase YgiN
MENEMLAIVVTLKVKPECEAAFEAVARQLAAEVNANEPGCKLYTASRSTTAPQTYVFMERYVDQAALEAHRATDYFKELGGKMGAYLDGRPEIQRLDEL